jgi:hypothetical protein
MFLISFRISWKKSVGFFSGLNPENRLTIDWLLPKLNVPQKKVLTGVFGGIRVKLSKLLFEN